MKYNNSNLDNKLKKIFQSDFQHAHLRQIQVATGQIRGLTTCSLSFDFPITAIAGKNGSGKSTVLALVCCAYHNRKSGYKSAHRKLPYYTFADFFIQHKEEIPPSGIFIKNHIAHNNWKPTASMPEGEGIAWQPRRKPKDGKWNEYAIRVRRDVAFIGIERIVPHSEKSQSKSYNRYFKSDETLGWEEKVGAMVGHILCKSYEEIKIAKHSKYRLPIVKSDGITFSGFNMGAGENALFEIFTTIYSAPTGSLIVIDEIELGLHIEAQKRFIKKLKEVCLERHIQIIFTTHSSEIFDCLPDEARIFIEKVNGKTIINVGSSSEHAFSKLSAENSRELTILVEDDIAKKLIALALPTEIRSRVHIEMIGSASALAIQLASNFKFKDSRKTVAVFDGDQRKKQTNNINKACTSLEISKVAISEWFIENSLYLPSHTWPEKWIIEQNKSFIDSLSELTNTDSETLSDILEQGLLAGKHNEFYEIGKLLSLSREDALNAFCMNITKNKNPEIIQLIETIKSKIG
jgi:predicted ATPase